MSPGRRVVITGVASHWGAELARRLERDPRIEYLAGIDTAPPAVELERTDFIEADLRSPLLSRLLPGTEADTVVHCGILWYPDESKSAGMLHEINVIGSLPRSCDTSACPWSRRSSGSILASSSCMQTTPPGHSRPPPATR